MVKFNFAYNAEEPEVLLIENVIMNNLFVNIPFI